MDVVIIRFYSLSLSLFFSKVFLGVSKAVSQFQGSGRA